MLTRTLCATRPRRANLPGPAPSSAPCRATWPPQDQCFPPACPFPSVGAPTTRIKCTLPFPALPCPAQPCPALPCPALPCSTDGAAASTCKFASIYWLPLSLLPALELGVSTGWATCVGGFSIGLPVLHGPQDTGRCCLPGRGSPVCPSPGCWEQESHLPPAPSDVSTRLWSWWWWVWGAVKGGRQGPTGTLCNKLLV